MEHHIKWLLIIGDKLVLSENGSPVFVQSLSKGCLQFIPGGQGVGYEWAVGHGPISKMDNFKTNAGQSLDNLRIW